MSQPRKDNWEKPRGKGQHLTSCEIAMLREAFDAGESHAEIARYLQCSSRIARGYFRQFRLGTTPVVVQRFRPQTQHRRRPDEMTK